MPTRPPNEPEASTSMGLLRRASLGDPRAWEDLVSVYSILVLRWCLRAGLQDSDAADIAQDVFRTLFLRLAEFEKSKPNHSFRRWLKTVTSNRIVDLRRARAKRPRPASDTWLFEERAVAVACPVEVEADPEAGPEWSLIRVRALDLLGGEFERQSLAAYRLVRIDGIAAAEAGRQLGISRNAVYLAVSRVGRRLRELFASVESKDQLL